MHRTLRLVSFTLLATAAACGSDSSGPAAGFECLGQALPTTAPPSIIVTGQTKGNVLTPNALSNVEVLVSRTGADTIGADTSNTPGFYSITVATGGTPVNGYLQLKKSGYITTYAYPAVPLAGDATENVLMVTPTEFSLLAQAAGITPTPGAGFIGIVVKNCAGTPIQGATVSSTPGGTVLYNVAGVPNSQAAATAADGVAYIANVTAGNVTVKSTASGHTLRQHVVNARGDAITLTEIQP
jgi:hypothetical protein